MERAARSFSSTACPNASRLGLLSTGSGDAPRHFLLMAGAGSGRRNCVSPERQVEGRARKGRVLDAVVSRNSDAVCRSLRSRPRAASFGPVSRWPAACATTAATWKSRPPFRCWMTSSKWCCLKAPAPSLPYSKYMLGVVAHRHQGMRGVTILRTRKALFSAPRRAKCTCKWMANTPASLRRAVEIVPNALTLLVPPEFRSRRPPAGRHGMDNITHTLTGLVLSRAGLEPLVCSVRRWC